MAKKVETKVIETPVVLKQFASRIPSDLHRAMKMACAGQGIKLETFVSSALQSALDQLTSKKASK